MNLVILTVFSASLASLFGASGLSPRDAAEAACPDVGRQPCGTLCVEQSHTCGPTGCPIHSVCWLGDHGLYGCCLAGKGCRVSGGSDITTDTISVPGNTSAITTSEPTSPGEDRTAIGETIAAETTTPSVAGPTGAVARVPNTTANSNATGAAAPTASSPPITAGIAANGLAASGLLGVVLVVFTSLLEVPAWESQRAP
ncbi:hypothetical protein J3459_014236 [Metarhizium acridum]|nr:hypothetical protein J3459_014236 [Metarhizium acridum]